MKPDEIDDAICDIMDGHCDGHERITHFVIELTRNARLEGIRDMVALVRDIFGRPAIAGETIYTRDCDVVSIICSIDPAGVPRQE